MKILITRPRTQAARFATSIENAGFTPICFPVVDIHRILENPALDRAIANLASYEWLVFTSVNGVDAVFDQYPITLRRVESGDNVKVAAIGPKTSQALQARGVDPDFVPGEYVAEAILPGLGDLAGKWVLLLRAEIARKALPEAIARAEGIPHEIAVYRTLPTEPDPAALAAIRAGVDWLTFTSPSTVHNFIAILRQHGMDPLTLPNTPKIACIGPITASAARGEGYLVDIVAADYTTEGLIQAICHD